MIPEQYSSPELPSENLVGLMTDMQMRERETVNSQNKQIQDIHNQMKSQEDKMNQLIDLIKNQVIDLMKNQQIAQSTD